MNSVRGGVSEARSSAARLESALRDVSDTPLIGAAIGGLASTAGRFEAELGDLTSQFGDFEGDLEQLRQDFQDGLAAASTARERYMSRWLAQPHDSCWPPTDPERDPVVTVERVQHTRPADFADATAVPESVLNCGPALPSAAPVVAAQTQVAPVPTSEPGLSQPSGRIAFSSDRDGNWEIYAINVDGSGLTRLTDQHGEDSSPRWSPDGQRILFQSDRDGNHEIFLMNADGSAVVRLTDDNKDLAPQWSPDGPRIAFTSTPIKCM